MSERHPIIAITGSSGAGTSSVTRTFQNIFHRYDRKEMRRRQAQAEPCGQEPGTFTAWEDLPGDTDLLFYEGQHGAVVTDEVDIARHTRTRR